MCTLTYLPTANGYTVTQNRDESPHRGSPIFPNRKDNVLFPKDPDGEGTWMATNGETVICVLNGGFVPHERKLPYKHSRGLLPLMLFAKKELELTLSEAQGLEPFSVFIFSKSAVLRYTWDASKLIRQEFSPNDNHIFQSAPLYSADVQDLREMWFDDWLQEHPSSSSLEILHFHQHAGDGDGETNICMYRPGVQTTAISQVEISGKNATFYLENILSGEISKERY